METKQSKKIILLQKIAIS